MAREPSGVAIGATDGELSMSTTFGVKLDEATQQHLKTLGRSLDRAPHWVLKTALAEFPHCEELAMRERAARWPRFQDAGEAIEQERVMTWLDVLAAGERPACPK